MEPRDFPRRQFLLQSVVGAGSAWFAAAWQEVLAAQQHAHHTMRAVDAGASAKFEFLMPAQAADVEAIASLIIPTADRSGAREAGVVYFIDRSLRTFAANRQNQIGYQYALTNP
jgi:Gluconate 2-dehydrogenase subunit 3